MKPHLPQELGQYSDAQLRWARTQPNLLKLVGVTLEKLESEIQSRAAKAKAANEEQNEEDFNPQKEEDGEQEGVSV